MARAISEREEQFLDLVAKEIAADFKASGVRAITPTVIEEAMNSIHNRMWAVLANEKTKEKVCHAVAIPIWLKGQKERVVNDFLFDLV